MENLTLYRKRIIPDECILLKDDIILAQTQNCIVTSWHSLKPKKDLDHGYSCYYLNLGIKVSKFCKNDGSLLYWYCDIVDYCYNAHSNTLVSLDLLADVIVYSDESVKVVDLNEIAHALDKNLITQEQLRSCLLHLNELLEIIYSGHFSTLQKPIEDLI